MRLDVDDLAVLSPRDINTFGQGVQLMVYYFFVAFTWGSGNLRIICEKAMLELL